MKRVMGKKEPPPATATARRRLAAFLSLGPVTSLEISGALSMSEREVAAHLPHLAKSLKSTGVKLNVDPAECLGCGFVFAKREKMTRPGKCPVCGSGRIDPPRFSIVAPDYS